MKIWYIRMSMKRDSGILNIQERWFFGWREIFDREGPPTLLKSYKKGKKRGNLSTLAQSLEAFLLSVIHEGKVAFFVDRCIYDRCSN